MSYRYSSTLNYIGRFWMWIFGWKVKAELPDTQKYVIVGAPHTSNWDFPFGLAMFFTLKIKLSWMAKETLFRPPFRSVLKALGGVAINRNNKHGVVDQMAEKFEQSEYLIIGLAANGTRKKTQYWKSGFYWIAYKAKVPIVFCYLDYKKKYAHIGLTINPSGNIKHDMEKIREFYQGVEGKIPENADNIRLKEED